MKEWFRITDLLVQKYICCTALVVLSNQKTSLDISGFIYAYIFFPRKICEIWGMLLGKTRYRIYHVTFHINHLSVRCVSVNIQQRNRCHIVYLFQFCNLHRYLFTAFLVGSLFYRSFLSSMTTLEHKLSYSGFIHNQLIRMFFQ